ncbi:MAG TPA: carboxylating nicotinate-nucleotide diphosphorylase [Candidatus Polarisedimenticolia bacterium]|nr:carboxylating nicotinate-nucleotide diphosphorylase [Candidatus Polarisedimenticolia bacterium]
MGSRRPRLRQADCLREVRRALAEDIRSGDRTTRRVVPPATRGRAVLRAKEGMVLAGLPCARLAFRLVDPALRFTALRPEGARLARGDAIARVAGRARSILTAERTALNFLQHLSGIATYTADCVARAAGRCSIRDTRKTTPGLRLLEKYAVRVGGGENHRLGLDDGILIKHNHWRVAGGVRAAVRRARRKSGAGRGLPVQVEVSTLSDLREAIAAGADSVLLDNLAPARLRRALKVASGRTFIEISGGIRRDNLERVARLRPGAVSLGALTHSSRWVDLSLSLEPLP